MALDTLKLMVYDVTHIAINDMGQWLKIYVDTVLVRNI